MFFLSLSNDSELIIFISRYSLIEDTVTSLIYNEYFIAFLMHNCVMFELTNSLLVNYLFGYIRGHGRN